MFAWTGPDGKISHPLSRLWARHSLSLNDVEMWVSLKEEQDCDQGKGENEGRHD